MKHGSLLKYFRPICLVLQIAPLLLSSATAHAQTSTVLPDAPLPRTFAPAPTESVDATPPPAAGQQNQNPPAQADPQAASPMKHAPYEKRKWAQYVDPGERIPPLYPEDKWVFWLHEEARVSSALPALISAGYGQLTTRPRSGQRQRRVRRPSGCSVGAPGHHAILLEQPVSGLHPRRPSLLSQSLRQLPLAHRLAAERAFVTQNDSGSHGFNFSECFGHLAASALTPCLLPEQKPQCSCGYADLGNLHCGRRGNNLFLEFWPDVMNLWHRHKQHAD